MKKIYIASFVVALAIIGGYFFPRNHTPQVVVGAVGDSNTTSKIAECSLDMSTTSLATASTTPTSSCLFNGSSQDRIVTAITTNYYNLGVMTFNGAGVASTTLTMATGTVLTSSTNTNYLWDSPLATTTDGSTAIGISGIYVSSTSPGILGTGSTLTTGVSQLNTYARIWKAGSYIVPLTNATSSTGTGTITISYIVAP